MRRLVPIALAIAVLAGSARAADTAAGSRFHIHLPDAGGPALAGDGVAWAERRPDGAANIRHAGFGGKRRSLVLAVPENGYRQRVRLAGSSSTLAVEVISGDKPGSQQFPSDWRFRDVYAGSPRGPLTRLATHCPISEVEQLPQTIDVSGPYVAHATCTDAAVITDTRTDAVVDVPGNGRGIRIAGRYVAWLNGTYGGGTDSIDVYDWKAHELAYSIPESGAPAFPQDLDLRADGTIVVTSDLHKGTRRVRWASPESPQLRTIRGGAGETYSVRFAGERIAFIRGPQFGFDASRATVGLTDLAGNERILARGARSSAFERFLDFDGDRVAWYAYSCTGARMHAEPIAPPVLRSESLRRCPLRFTRKPRVKSSRRIKLHPDCYGYAAGVCDVSDVVVRLAEDPRTVVGRSKSSRWVKMTDDGAELLEKNGKLKVRVTMTLDDQAGPSERRSGKTTFELP